MLDLGFAREIDDRLLSPLPVWWVPLEKVLFAALRGTVASAVIFPLGWIILGSGFDVRTDRLGILAGMVVLTGLVGATIGLLMGTIIKPEQISLMFTLIFHSASFHWLYLLSLGRPVSYSVVPSSDPLQSAHLRVGRLALRNGSAGERA